MQGYPTQPRNLGFEEGLDGWRPAGQRYYTIGVDQTVTRTGKGSVMLQSQAPGAGRIAYLVQTLRIVAYRGKRLRLSGYIKTQSVTGAGGLWVGIETARGNLSRDDSVDRPLTGSADWTQHEVVIDVPVDGDAIIYLGIFLQGQGTIWLDDVEVQACC
jgi:hypothetical protein